MLVPARFRDCLACVALDTAAVVLSGLAAPVSAAPPRPGWLVAPRCAWPAAMNAAALKDNHKLNIHNPDAAAACRIMPFTVQPGLRITLTLGYAASRYISVEAYGSHGLPFTTDGVNSALTNYQIVPDPATCQRGGTRRGRVAASW